MNDTSCDISVSPKTIARGLFALIALLVLVGTGCNVVIYHVAPSPDSPIAQVLKRFDLGHEPSLPGWYSSVALAFASALSFLIAVVKRRMQEPYLAHWYGMSAMLLLMAIDEAIMIHEMSDNTMRDFLDASGPLYFAWVIPAFFAVLIVAAVYFRFLLHLDPRTRRLVFTSACLFVTGAIGLEMVAGVVFTIGDGVNSLAHTISQSVEESLEMLGVLVFIYAMLDYIGSNYGSITVRLEDRSD